jgi:hypothetical protein
MYYDFERIARNLGHEVLHTAGLEHDNKEAINDPKNWMYGSIKGSTVPRKFIDTQLTPSQLERVRDFVNSNQNK